jgi:phospholipid/cholesterol/gamma-HCH transport system substrate-binding protein
VKHLDSVMGFIRKWALSTNGHDGLAHYIRGVFYVTPSTLTQLLKSYLPTQKTVDSKSTKGTSSTGKNDTDLLDTVDGVLDGVTGLLDGLLPNTGSGLLGLGRADTKAPAGGSSAFGLTKKQEQSMLQQLLGGN